MIRFGTGFGGILALIITLLIIECIHFGIILLIWKFVIVEVFNVPMITLWQAILIEIMVRLMVEPPHIKPVIIRR